MKSQKTVSRLAVLLLATWLVACGGGEAATATTAPPTASAPMASVASTPAASASSAAPSIAQPSVSATTAVVQPSASAASAVTQASASATAPTTPPSSAPATPTAAAATRYAIVPGKSSATYKVGEVFLNQGNQYNLAVGKTGEVTGDIFIDRTRPSASKIGTIKVDISKLESDSGRRDDGIRGEWLESSKFPIATFVPKRLEGLPDAPYQEGQELTFKIIGDLTIRTVTKEVTFDATARIVGDTLTGTAVTRFNMTDFGFDPPSILFFLKAENAVELVMDIEAKRAP